MTPEDATRRFPFTVRPRHLETLDSYTRRTFEANGERPALRRELMKLVPGSTWESVLSAKVGRTLGRLVAPKTVGVHDACAPCAALLSNRWACLHCTRGEHVQQHPHLEDFLCERHHRWVGPGTEPEAQRRVSLTQVAAHRKFRDLRRRGRIDMPLLLSTLETLARDLHGEAQEVFDVAVGVVAWVTRQDTLRRLFDPAQPYAGTFAWLQRVLSELTGTATPETARVVWRRLWPAHVALQTAWRGYGTYGVAHIHDFALPADIAQWFPHPAMLQTADEYLRCIGDYEPTVAKPVLREAYCPKGHRYTEVLTSVEHAQTPCPRCTRHSIVPGVNDLQSVSPPLAAQLHPTLNGELSADDIAAASSHPVWWLCDEFHPYLASPSKRTRTRTGCAVCRGLVILVGVNDLATTHPDIASELHSKSCSSKRANELTASDTKERHWVCPDGHQFRASVVQRVFEGKSCETCEKRNTRASRRSFAVTHPELAATWRPELNEGRDPRDYTKVSALEVMWWCENGHPFPMRIEPRTRGCGCPYCANRLILRGFNDFVSTHNELAADWHSWRNWKRPTEVTADSTEEFQWKCRNGHGMRQSIADRIEAGGCAECPGRERAGNRRPVAKAA